MKTTLLFLLIVICSAAVFPHITLAQDDRPIVQVIYFRANDKPPRPDVDAEIDRLIKETQLFFADEMERHEFGRKTFQIETDANGNTVVHHVVGKFPYAHYLEEVLTWIEETPEQLGGLHERNNIRVYMIETHGGGQEFPENNPGGVCGHGVTSSSVAGSAHIYCWQWTTVAHELGHACGLRHDFRLSNGVYIMSYGPDMGQLSKCAAEWLEVHRAFNRSQPRGFLHAGARAKLLLLSRVPPLNVTHLQIELTRVDGAHQIQLVGKKNRETPLSLITCKRLNGKPRSIVDIVTTELTPEFEGIWIQVINRLGYFRMMWKLTPGAPSDRLAEDVNGDGVVDMEDLMLVAASFGTAPAPGTLPDTDVNDDGVINHTDVEWVLAALEGAPAAPALDTPWITKSLQRWIAEAKRRNRGDMSFQRGIAVLEALLADRLPQMTVLLANYPNPFNPETWIPYQLSEPAEVLLHIYSVEGALVRRLALGQLPAGIYQSRTRAAYWDGRNELGESVASGVYFYTLTAGDFTATRKMLIQK